VTQEAQESHELIMKFDFDPQKAPGVVKMVAKITRTWCLPKTSSGMTDRSGGETETPDGRVSDPRAKGGNHMATSADDFRGNSVGV
jgi:hypothetical protein